MMLSHLLFSVSAALAIPLQNRQAPHNDFSCRSATHPNPVVLFHGLGATYYEDLNFLQDYLQNNDFCTFSITYGAYPDFPLVGGLEPIQQSSAQLEAFVNQVKTNTGAAKVDLVGHSEGGFQTLYVTKFGGISSFVDHVFAIAPPTHGTTFANLYELAEIGGNLTVGVVDGVLDAVGCDACSELLPNGTAVERLDNGPIAQPGVSYTILASRYDELVTPPSTAFIDEPGVRNIYVQDYCPDDPVGHIGEAYDLNVWALVLNTLSGSTAGPTVCTIGSPGK